MDKKHEPRELKQMRLYGFQMAWIAYNDTGRTAISPSQTERNEAGYLLPQFMEGWNECMRRINVGRSLKGYE